ncbi:MAG: hypothetical protein JJT82_00690 [Legionellaceae bacterium]|nr:hypothetical protein [Legionellaceae bacterium]
MLKQNNDNDKKHLYIIGMGSMVLSILFLIFGLYCLPHFIWGWYYDIPSIIFIAEASLTHDYGFSEGAAATIMFLTLISIGVFFGFIAYICSWKLDRELLLSERPDSETQVTKPAAKGARIALLKQLGTIFLILLAVLTILFAVEWLISSPATL